MAAVRKVIILIRIHIRTTSIQISITLINYILILDQKVIENSTEEVKYGLGTQVLKQLGSFQIIIYKSNGYI